MTRIGTRAGKMGRWTFGEATFVCACSLLLQFGCDVAETTSLEAVDGDGGLVSSKECGGTMCGTECVDLQTDPKYCGSCEQGCSSNHLTPSCVAGKCVGPCDYGHGDCNSDLRSDGCETDLSSPTNCRACGTVCAVDLYAAGQCDLTEGCYDCNGGQGKWYGNCDGNPLNGCEAHLWTDASNCGGCGNICPPGYSCAGYPATCTPPSL